MSVYLNHAATSVPKAPGVADAVAAALDAVPDAGRSAGGGVDPRGACRRSLARLLGGAAERCVLTHGGTAALNAAVLGTLRPGDHAVVGVLEHTSVTRPLAHLAQTARVTVHTLDSTDDGFYRPDALEALLRATGRGVKLVTLSHGSNVAGSVQPVAELAAATHEAAGDALFLLDACQTAGHVPVDADGWGVDLLATGGHKGLLGPPGTGVLMLSERAAGRVRPTVFGGTGAGGGDGMPAEVPHRLEPGTPNLPAFAGLAVALDWIDRAGVAELHRRSVERVGELLDRLRAVPGVRALGPADADRRCGLVAFTLDGWDAHEAASVLYASFGVVARAGLHCAPGAHERFGTAAGGGAVRLSVGPFTTAAEVRTAADAVAELAAA